MGASEIVETSLAADEGAYRLTIGQLLSEYSVWMFGRLCCKILCTQFGTRGYTTGETLVYEHCYRPHIIDPIALQISPFPPCSKALQIDVHTGCRV